MDADYRLLEQQLSKAAGGAAAAGSADDDWEQEVGAIPYAARPVIEARWGQNCWHSLGNCNHGDSMTTRLDSRRGSWRPAHTPPLPLLAAAAAAVARCR
jgi:hypothetical protein